MRIAIDKNATRGILFFIFVFSVAYTRYRISENVGDVMVVVESLLIALALLLCRREEKSFSISFFVYLVFMITRLADSFYLTGGIKGEAKVLVYRELGAAIFLMLIMTYSSRIKFYILLRNIGIINALFGCIEYLMRTCWFSRFITVMNHKYMLQNMLTDKWRVRTVFLHPLVCAVFTLITWVLLIYMPCKNRWIQIVSQIAVVICLIGTKARSSWVSFAIVSALIIVVRQIKGRIEVSRSAIYRLFFITVLITLTMIFFWDNIYRLFGVVSSRLMSATSLSDVGRYNRVTMFKVGLNEFNKASTKNKILGFGPDYAINMLKAHPIRGWNKAVDNTYVSVLLNYGLLGLILHLGILLLSISNMLRTKSHISEMCAVGVISIFVSAFFYEMYSWFTVTVCFIMLLLGQTDSYYKDNYYEKSE